MKVSFSYKGNAPDTKQHTFTFNKKEWPDEDNIQKRKIDDPNGGTEYSEKFRILSGKEHPELFLLWLRTYRTKVWNNQIVDYRSKMSIFHTLCKEDAQTVLQQTVEKTTGWLDNPDNQIPFSKHFCVQKHPDQE